MTVGLGDSDQVACCLCFVYQSSLWNLPSTRSSRSSKRQGSRLNQEDSGEVVVDDNYYHPLVMEERTASKERSLNKKGRGEVARQRGQSKITDFTDSLFVCLFVSLLNV